MIAGEHFILTSMGIDIPKEQYQRYEITGIVDQNGVIKYVSHGHKIITGFQPSEITGTRLTDRINPIDLPYIYEQHQKMIETKQPIESKYEIKNKDGIYFVARSLVIPQFEGEDFCGSVIFTRKRTVDINLFRKTRILSEFKYAI